MLRGRGRGASGASGTRAHVGMDGGSGLIREAVFTPANVNDTEVGDALVSGDEEGVYADKAYGSQERSTWLAAMGIEDGIMRRGNKHHPELPEAERRRNARLSWRSLARLLGVSPYRIREWRRGAVPASVHLFLLLTLAERLGSSRTLMCGERDAPDA